MNKKRPRYSWLLFALVIAAVVYVIIKNTGEIRQYEFSYRWSFLAMAFFAEALAYLIQFCIWLSISGDYGVKAPFLKASKGFFLSILGKYLPGKVGLALVRINAYRGYSKKQVSVATGFEVICSLASVCLLILAGVFSISDMLPSYAVWVSASGILAILVFLYPPLFLRIVNTGFQLIKRQPLVKSPTYGATLKFIIAFMLVGLFHGLGLYFALYSLSEISFSYYLTITSVYYAAGLIGFFAVFAPAGIGVREGIMMLILPAFIHEPVVIVGVILIRLVMTAVELSLAGISVILEKINR